MADSESQQLIKNYEDALRELTEVLSAKNIESNLLEERLLRVLVARDDVQAHIVSEFPLCAHDLKKICELDDWSTSITEAFVSSSRLEKWQKILKPSPEAWWWFPKAPTHPLDRLDWAWSGLSFFFLVISFGLCTNIATRFFAGGSDPVGITLIAAQSVLGFLSAKGSIPLALQEQVQKAIGTTKLSKRWLQEIRCILALLFLALSIGFYQALPLVSNFYFWRGVDQESDGHLGNAENSYNRAIFLNPNNISAHYNLGFLYEKMQMADRARLEYKIATTQGGDTYAYSNLARLDILEGRYSTAVSLANEGLKNLEEDEPDKARRKRVEYALRKNLGWARLKQKRYEEAQDQLKKAIVLNNERAAAYCLIAQAFEAENKKTESLFHWKVCSQLGEKEIKKWRSNRFPVDEDGWVGQANECLKPKYRSKKCLGEN